MNLLVIDDSHTKVEWVMQAVTISGIDVDITHETNAASARRRLRGRDFDLVLIDLQLPDMPGASPNINGGIQFFDLIQADPHTSIPKDFLFVTNEDGLVSEGRKKVESRGASLCVVSAGTSGGIDILAGRLLLAHHRSRKNPPKFDIAVMTAMASELEAVLELEYNWQSFRLIGDPTLYYKGNFEVDGSKRTIVAASAIRKGMAASSAIATKLAIKFQPRILAMTGICAGVKTKTGLGDVIIGSPTWDWGSGKHAVEHDGSEVFKLSPKQSDLAVELEVLCDEISRSIEFKRSVRAGWSGDIPSGEFRCHIGPMASGASVIANSSVAEEISRQNRDLIGIEMEAFAVMVAAEYATTNPLLSIAIKSVCDFADKEKQDGWQKYAAYTSARFANEVFRRQIFS